ncbi:hypothetical protein K432DRAFT_377971 [Lepidopterella palustris CBS 459.81]|uniref:Uncharacterized protein n=1 Tax=Lepidopterella palustris CBS 459.81 TaxID=1314670 RepID=A0A8E2EJM6_9PEZI|nr:hypothetical protein K432DRAFT_377971 [Lepidopterella palustris CBS 459.81]
MCYHRLYIFTTCGHSSFALHPLPPCPTARVQMRQTQNQPLDSSKPLPIARAPQPPTSPTSPNSSTFLAHSPSRKGKGKGKGKGPIFSTPDRSPASGEDLSVKCTGPQSHPFQSFRINRICAVCARRRDVLLAEAEEGKGVKFEDWKWKVKYQSPRSGEGKWIDWSGVGEVMGSWVGGWGGFGGHGERSPWTAVLRETSLTPAPGEKDEGEGVAG